MEYSNIHGRNDETGLVVRLCLWEVEGEGRNATQSNSTLPHSKWMLSQHLAAFQSCLSYLSHPWPFSFILNILSYSSEQCRVTDAEDFTYLTAGLPPLSKYA